MSDVAEDVKGLVETVVRSLVDNEDDLEITVRENDDCPIYIEVSVNDEDIGKVIGRQGRIIKSIRTLARAVAAQTGDSVDVEIAD